ncbi:MAG: Rrf2 family iron-sulfur cluster assembly transcriptional regulator [Rickettsiales bacterium]
MLLTNKAKYATIAVIDMLENGCEKPVSLSLIASRQNISLSFLEQIFSSLKKAQIVKSIRGASGGYILAQDPHTINVADIILAIDEPIKMTRCSGEDGCVTKNTRCTTHHLWQGLEKNIYNYLSSIFITDIGQESLKSS